MEAQGLKLKHREYLLYRHLDAVVQFNILKFFLGFMQNCNTFNSLANAESDSKPKAFDSLFY